jgi:uncharacterized protein
MRIEVKVVTRSCKNSVEQKENIYIVRTTTVPEHGKANAQVIKILAHHFNVAKGCIMIIRGHGSREKIIDVTI